MGLPAGHVTGHGLRPAQELKMLGNGVVPQQAELALRMLLGLPAVAVAPATDVLPTPRVAADRNSRASLVRDGHWSAPALAQVVEMVQGILPREYESWDEVQGAHAGLRPQP